MSLSSLCVQVLLSVWSEAAEAMPAVIAGWLARRRAEVSLSSLCVQVLLEKTWPEVPIMLACVRAWA